MICNGIKIFSFIILLLTIYFIALTKRNIIYYNIVEKYDNSSKYIFDKKKTVSKEFILHYKNEENNLYKQIERTKICLKKYEKDLDHAYRCNEYRIKIPHPSRIKYTEIYDKYNGGYKAILEPPTFSGYDIIYGLPFAPPYIDGRIAARNTVFKEEYIDGLRTKYLFFTGLIPETLFSYKYSDLKEEQKMFEDIIVFDMINTYYNITLLMMSMHRWLIEKYPDIKYFIRCNLDALVFPWRIKGFLNKGYDIITEMVLKNGVNFPQGSFYIFSMKTVRKIYERSFTHKTMHRADDFYYGQIIKNESTIKIYNLRAKKIQMIWDCQFCKYVKSNLMIAMHPYSPASIMIMYNETKTYN